MHPTFQYHKFLFNRKGQGGQVEKLVSLGLLNIILGTLATALFKSQFTAPFTTADFNVFSESARSWIGLIFGADSIAITLLVVMFSNEFCGNDDSYLITKLFIFFFYFPFVFLGAAFFFFVSFQYIFIFLFNILFQVSSPQVLLLSFVAALSLETIALSFFLIMAILKKSALQKVNQMRKL